MSSNKEYYCTHCQSTIAESDLRCKVCKSELGAEGSFGLRNISLKPKTPTLEKKNKVSPINEKLLRKILTVSTIIYFTLLTLLGIVNALIKDSIIILLILGILTIFYTIVVGYIAWKIDIDFFKIKPVKDRVPLIISSIIVFIRIISLLNQTTGYSFGKQLYDQPAFTLGELIGGIIIGWFILFYILKGIKEGAPWIIRNIKNKSTWSQLPTLTKIATIVALVVGSIWVILFLVGFIMGISGG